MDILVAKKYTTQEVRKAELKRDEFVHGRYTSGSANLDNMIALGKAVILCGAHARKFNPVAARYCPHPAANMKQVVGACDVCRTVGLSSLFLNEVDAFAERRKAEHFRRAYEYGSIVTN